MREAEEVRQFGQIARHMRIEAWWDVIPHVSPTCSRGVAYASNTHDDAYGFEHGNTLSGEIVCR